MSAEHGEHQQQTDSADQTEIQPDTVAQELFEQGREGIEGRVNSVSLSSPASVPLSSIVSDSVSSSTLLSSVTPSSAALSTVSATTVSCKALSCAAATVILLSAASIADKAKLVILNKK